MDIADIAQELEDLHRKASLSAVKKYSGVSALRCVDCDDDIPEARRVSIPGCQRCTFCQSIVER